MSNQPTPAQIAAEFIDQCRTLLAADAEAKPAYLRSLEDGIAGLVEAAERRGKITGMLIGAGGVCSSCAQSVPVDWDPVSGEARHWLVREGGLPGYWRRCDASWIQMGIRIEQDRAAER